MYQIFPARRQTGRGREKEREGKGTLPFRFLFQFWFRFRQVSSQPGAKLQQVLDSPNKPGKFREIVKVLFSPRERDGNAEMRKRKRRGRGTEVACFSDSYLVQGFARQAHRTWRHSLQLCFSLSPNTSTYFPLSLLYPLFSSCTVLCCRLSQHKISPTRLYLFGVLSLESGIMCIKWSKQIYTARNEKLKSAYNKIVYKTCLKFDIGYFVEGFCLFRLFSLIISG